MVKQVTAPTYAASLWHKPVGGKEIVFASTNLIATADLAAIQEARGWAFSLVTNECTVLRVMRAGYQIRAIRVDSLAAAPKTASAR